MHILEQMMGDTTCDGCHRSWLGKLFGTKAEPLCNQCRAALVDERPRDPMPSDSEIDGMYEAWEKGQAEKEAYRAAH